MTPQAVRRNLFGRATESVRSALPSVVRWLCVANFLTIYPLCSVFAACFVELHLRRLYPVVEHLHNRDHNDQR